MIGHYISRLTLLIFGTLFPAYSSYKAIKNKDVREYSRWMMYWIVFAIFSFFEVFADIFIGFWLPFYYEMKILFVLWLMSPYGNGSKIVYLHFIHPQLTSREQTIDLYIDSVKQMGITSVYQLWTKGTEIMNKSLIYLFQIIQTIVFHQIQRQSTDSIDGPRIQNQQLLSQPNFLQQFLFMRSPEQTVQTLDINEQVINLSANRTTAPLSQRWYSEEALNIIEISDEFKPTPKRSNLRTRCESESNLTFALSDDWVQMEVSEIDGKPPVQPSKGKKKTKGNKNAEKPLRRTARAAALKARAKCKEEESLPEEY